MEESDQSVLALIPECEKLAAFYSMMQQECSYRLSKISLLILKVADFRALCESGCSWLSMESTSRQEEIMSHNLPDCDEISSLQGIESKMGCILLSRMDWLRGFAQKVVDCHASLDDVYNQISDLRIEEMETEEGKLSELYKEFYVEKAKYKRLLPPLNTPLIPSSISCNPSRRMTRSSAATNDSSHVPPSQTRSRGKQITAPLPFDEPIDVDLVSPDRSHDDDGNRKCHAFRVNATMQPMNQADGDCVEDEDNIIRSGIKETDSSQTSTKDHEPITLDDSETDSDENGDHSSSHINISPFPCNAKYMPSIAERNREILFQSNREAAVAATATASYSLLPEDSVQNGDIAYNTDADYSTPQQSRNGDKGEAESVDGSEPEKFDDIPNDLLPLPLEVRLPLSRTLSGTHDSDVSSLCSNLSSNLPSAPNRKRPNADSSSSYIMQYQSSDRLAPNGVSCKTSTRHNPHNSLLELCSNSSTEQTLLTQDNFELSRIASMTLVVPASSIEVNSSSSNGSSNRNCRETKKRLKEVGVGDPLSQKEDFHNGSCRVGVDIGDQVEHYPQKDIEPSSEGQPKILASCPSGSSNSSKIDLTDDS